LSIGHARDGTFEDDLKAFPRHGGGVGGVGTLQVLDRFIPGRIVVIEGKPAAQIQ
jgi:hypothetical protein